MSRFRNTFLLVLVFVALFSYFWVYQKDKKAPEPDTPTDTTETVPLTSYKLDDITEISWKSASYSATLQSLGNQKWKLAQPAIPVDDTKVSTYLGSINSLTGMRKYKASELAQANTKLDSPVLTVTVKKKDNSTEVIKVGGTTLDGDYNYATKEGSDTVTLLSSYVLEDLNKDPNALKPDPSASPAPSAASTTGSGSVTGTPTPQF